MNIVPTSIKGFNLQFTEAELIGLIEDLPVQSKYRGPLVAARNGAFDEDQTADAPTAKRKPGRRPKSTGDSLAKQTCPHCQKEIAKKFFANHLRKKHGLENE